MPKHFRLIVGEWDPWMNMAIDEAVMYARGMGAVPDTVRLYVFSPSAVTIGYFQSLRSTVNIGLAKELGVPVVRRVSGGGAVYHDEFGEVTYSVVLPEDSVPRDFEESFRYLTEAVVRAARKLGLPADYVPLNDVVVEGRKISGQAQARKRGVVLQHGTFMYATNIDLLASLLTPPAAKLAEKGIASIKDRVITASQYLGRVVSKEEVINAFIEAFEEVLDAEPMRGRLTPLELDLAKSLKWKYSSSEWLSLRP